MRPGIAFQWDIPAFLARAGIAWRFLRGRSTEGDGYELVRAGELASRSYGFAGLLTDSLVEDLEARFGGLTDAQVARADEALRFAVAQWDGSVAAWNEDKALLAGTADVAGKLMEAAADRWIEWSREAGEALQDHWEPEQEDNPALEEWTDHVSAPTPFGGGAA